MQISHLKTYFCFKNNAYPGNSEQIPAVQAGIP